MKTPRFLTKRFAAAALLAVLATVAFAQDFGGQGGPPPGGPGGPGGRGGRMGGGRPALDRLPPLGNLALRPEIADELGLTDDQRGAIEEIAQSSRPPRPGQGGPGQGGQGGPPDRSARDAADAAADTRIKAILSGVQAKRLAEIQIQTMGLTAAMVPAVQVKLGLSDDQKASLKALVPAQGPGGRGGPGGPPDGGPGGPPPDGGGFGGPGGRGGQGGPPPGGSDGPGGRGGRGGDPMRQALESKIATILTDGQKSALKALGGKPLPNRRPPQG